MLESVVLPLLDWRSVLICRLLIILLLLIIVILGLSLILNLAVARNNLLLNVQAVRVCDILSLLICEP